jgi:membrane-associated phospholipid phosphatase
MLAGCRGRVFAALLLVASYSSVYCQEQTNTTRTDAQSHPADSKADHKNQQNYTTERTFFRNTLSDQYSIWTSPARFQLKDLPWATQFAGITTGLIMTDRTTSSELSRGNHIGLANSFSNAGIGLMGGTTAAMYLWGLKTGDDHMRETGLLVGEAGLNSLTLSEVFKYAFSRDRPNQGDGTGHFFRSGGSSFYSAHATIAFTFASVVSSEYPSWYTSIGSYSAATAISLARVAGKQHFPSDVFVGGVMGYLIGKQVYRAHHNPELGSENCGTFVHTKQPLTLQTAGSTYVPLDSWVYPAIERLSALGIIHGEFLGLRPWTRTQIALLVSNAEKSSVDKLANNTGASLLLQRLESDFSPRGEIGVSGANQSIRLESLYTQSTYISGQPLNSSYYFGQTLINNFGRPYQEGYNQVTGFTARAEEGRFAYYVRGEYQHAPSAPAYSPGVEQVIAQASNIPVQAPTPFPEVNDFRLLDAYVSGTLAGNAISVGKQSLWWGPGEGGAMIMSDNAEPFYMLQINRTVPFTLPSIFKYMGPIRYDGFFGRLAGHQYPPRPFMHGEKISFQPTKNLEFGFSRTAVFAGEGITPLTVDVFLHSLFSTTSSTNPGSSLRNSPGARHSAFDFSYKIPWLRDWLTLYSDSLVHDDVSPVDAPRRAAINPGIYLAKFPKLNKLDLRVEAVNTDPPITNSNGGKFIYWEGIYRDMYLNEGNLLGNWIGREGKGIQAWSTYWLNPTTNIQVAYRHATIAKDFIPSGESINDVSVRGTLHLKPDVELQAFVQYELWKAPVLASTPQSDVTGALQLTFWPKELFKRSH